MDIRETRPALFTVAMRIYCDGMNSKDCLNMLKNHVVNEFNGNILYEVPIAVVLEFPYQFVSIASKAYISAIAYDKSCRGGLISLIFSILDLMYPFSGVKYASEHERNIIESFEDTLKQACKGAKIRVEVVDVRFYDYPFRLQDIPYIQFYGNI